MHTDTSLEQRVRPWTAIVLVCLGALAITFAHGADLPFTAKRVQELSGGVPVLDRSSYDAARAYEMIGSYGPEGRAVYLRMLWTVDLLLPLSVGFAFAAVVMAALRRAPPGSPLRWAPVLFILMGIPLDYGENVLVTLLLLKFPMELPRVAEAAAWFTELKRLVHRGGVVLSLLSVGYGLFQWWMSRRAPADAAPPSPRRAT